ncbi:MAG TPA: FAD-binding protein [Pseudonocardiaceae bacterium]|nr:FAD-binding protein [Pseudonocardiaceae bacterium]
MRLTELAWDGSFTTGGSALDEAADDFGHIVHQRPAGVLRPGSVADVGTLLRHVNGIPVVARGRGHSAYGQAQTDGIVLDMSGLADIGPVVGDRITVQAGADWRSVLTATLRHGLTPPVLTDYLGLSVGGTLSVGGIGGTSHRYGAQTDHVVAVDVTTPPGEHHACTPSDDLFHDVLAGRGRHGIITAATLNLIPAPAVVHRHQLFYAGLAALRADQHVLRHLDFVQADILPGETGWQYVLDVVADELPPTQHVAEEAETLSYFDFADRLAAGELYFRSTGEWFHPHPWWTGFLPSDAFLDQILTETTPADVGPSGLILTYPIPTAKLKTRQLAVPEGEVAVHISLLRTSTPETVAEALAANQKWQARALAAGGTSYPIGTT